MMTIDRTPAAKVKNAIKYFQDRIPSPSNIKIRKLLQLANEYAMNHSGVPITWLTEDQNKTIDHNSIAEFDDSAFSDYEIDIMDLIIRRYRN
ncbi:hypothetical protein [Pedobacter sp. MC2016-24]|uniref:hypothetical protein n=1 Tax=Pedobacter sp. MC2016-24 TaxID=2780090 RepID=UPI00187F7579|nr:hypothetical protein [Pedobacter sp. MC2016-24]MBE9603125.1 hypothetical protein [Pedobacter sp. MC2016-24]